MRGAGWGLVVLAVAWAGCDSGTTGDVLLPHSSSDAGVDAGHVDAGHPDAGPVDAGALDAGEPDAGHTPVVGDGGCFVHQLSWGYTGGLTDHSDSSVLVDCQAFTFTRRLFVAADAGGSCQAQLDAGTSAAFAAALNEPDVLAAFSAAPILYGIDKRPVDGAVFQVIADGWEIDIGDACSGQSGCTDAPAGVSALAGLLQTTTASVRSADPGCPQ